MNNKFFVVVGLNCLNETLRIERLPSVGHLKQETRKKISHLKYSKIAAKKIGVEYHSWLVLTSLSEIELSLMDENFVSEKDETLK